jgi:hypothetical protein
MKRKLIQGSLLFLIMVFVARADDSTTGVDLIATPPNFGAMSYEDGNKAVNEIIRSVVSTRLKKVGPEFVAGLVEQLEQGNLIDEKKVLVIYVLGHLRPKDAHSIDVLIENIDLKAPRMDPATDIARWGMYPAADALERIGVPVIDPILNHLPNEGNDLRRHLMCRVLKSVEGKDTANKQIKERLAGESNLSKRANLGLSLKEVE